MLAKLAKAAKSRAPQATEAEAVFLDPTPTPGPLAARAAQVLGPARVVGPLQAVHAAQALGPSSRAPGPIPEEVPREPERQEPPPHRSSFVWRPPVEEVHTMVDVDVCLTLNHRDRVVLPSQKQRHRITRDI